MCTFPQNLSFQNVIECEIIKPAYKGHVYLTNIVNCCGYRLPDEVQDKLVSLAYEHFGYMDEFLEYERYENMELRQNENNDGTLVKRLNSSVFRHWDCLSECQYSEEQMQFNFCKYEKMRMPFDVDLVELCLDERYTDMRTVNDLHHMELNVDSIQKDVNISKHLKKLCRCSMVCREFVRQCIYERKISPTLFLLGETDTFSDVLYQHMYASWFGLIPGREFLYFCMEYQPECEIDYPFELSYLPESDEEYILHLLQDKTTHTWSKSLQDPILNLFHTCEYKHETHEVLQKLLHEAIQVLEPEKTPTLMDIIMECLSRNIMGDVDSAKIAFTDACMFVENYKMDDSWIEISQETVQTPECAVCAVSLSLLKMLLYSFQSIAIQDLSYIGCSKPVDEKEGCDIIVSKIGRVVFRIKEIAVIDIDPVSGWKSEEELFNALSFRRRLYKDEKWDVHKTPRGFHLISPAKEAIENFDNATIFFRGDPLYWALCKKGGYCGIGLNPKNPDEFAFENCSLFPGYDYTHQGTEKIKYINALYKAKAEFDKPELAQCLQSTVQNVIGRIVKLGHNWYTTIHCDYTNQKHNNQNNNTYTYNIVPKRFNQKELQHDSFNPPKKRQKL